MNLRIAENFRAVFYAPFYAIRALGLAEREGLAVEWLPSDAPGRPPGRRPDDAAAARGARRGKARCCATLRAPCEPRAGGWLRHRLRRHLARADRVHSLHQLARQRLEASR